MTRKFQKNIFVLFDASVKSQLYKKAETIKSYAQEQKMATIKSNDTHAQQRLKIHVEPNIYIYIFYFLVLKWVTECVTLQCEVQLVFCISKSSHPLCCIRWQQCAAEGSPLFRQALHFLNCTVYFTLMHYPRSLHFQSVHILPLHYRIYNPTICFDVTNFYLQENTLLANSTFCGPCIVIYLRNKDQQDALLFLNLFR